MLTMTLRRLSRSICGHFDAIHF